MNKQRRIILTILIPSLTIIFATFEYTGFSDKLLGRKRALDGFYRLSSPKGYPEIIIFNDEREFSPLIKLIMSNTSNKHAKILYKNGKIPTAIARVGGTLSPPGALDKKLLKDGFDPRFVPDTSPVLVFYNYTRKGPRNNIPEDERIAKAVCNLGNIRQWIDNSRNRDRFIVSTLLIGLLSIVVAIFELTGTKKDT